MNSVKRLMKLTAAALILLLAFSTVSYAALQPGGPSTDGETNIHSTLSYKEVVKILEDIERTSQGKVKVSTLDKYGKSEQGRSIYVAKVGNGPKKIWIQAQIHGNEKLVTEAALQLLKTYGNSGEKDVERVLEEATLYFIPMYNPDGAEMNIRHTKLAGSGKLIDLNRDWTLKGFEAVESKVVYAYWADVNPDFAIDLHHQGFKQVYGTNESTSFSLGVSLSPDGPTLPKETKYNEITKQMMSYVYNDLKDYGYTHIDRYQVGVNREKGIGYDIDIKGGVVSAMMLGLNYNNLNPEGHSHPAVFFETKGNSSDGSLGQKSNGYLTKQNYLALKSLVHGYVTGEVQKVNPNDWYSIPYYPLAGYSTDYAGTIPVNSGY
jgi:hypothetical protein